VAAGEVELEEVNRSFWKDAGIGFNLETVLVSVFCMFMGDVDVI